MHRRVALLVAGLAALALIAWILVAIDGDRVTDLEPSAQDLASGALEENPKPLLGTSLLPVTFHVVARKTGEPLTGTVRVEVEGREVARAEANGRGEARLSLPRQLVGEVVATVPGLPVERMTLDLRQVSTRDAHDVTLQVGGACSLAIQVVGGSAAVHQKGLVVTVAGDPGGSVLYSERLVPDEARILAIDELPAGQHRVSLTGSHWAVWSGAAVVDLQPGANTVRVLLKREGPNGLAQGEIVLAEGVSTRGWIVYWRRRGVRLSGVAPVDDDGRFALPLDEASASYELFLRPAGSLGPLHDERGTDTSGRASRIRLKPDELREVRLQVIGDPAPSAGLPVHVVGPAGDAGARVLLRTDAQGSVVVYGSRVGHSYSIYVGPTPDGRCATGNITKTGEVTPLELRPGLTISGTATLPIPVETFDLKIVAMLSFPLEFEFPATKGDFEIVGLVPHAQWRLRAEATTPTGERYRCDFEPMRFGRHMKLSLDQGAGR